MDTREGKKTTDIFVSLSLSPSLMCCMLAVELSVAANVTLL